MRQSDFHQELESPSAVLGCVAHSGRWLVAVPDVAGHGPPTSGKSLIDNDVLARILNCLALGVRSQCNSIRTTFEGPVTGYLELSHRKSKLHSECMQKSLRPDLMLALPTFAGAFGGIE